MSSGDEQAARYAPLLCLHPAEQLWPMSAGDYLAEAKLCFAHSGSDHVVWPEDPQDAGIDAARLTRGPDVYRHSLGSDEFTRPHDADPQRVAGLAPNDGFYLTAPDSVLTGTAPVGTGEYTGASAYYQYGRAAGRAFVSYWFFYPASALPRRIRDALEVLAVEASGDAGREAGGGDVAVMERQATEPLASMVLASELEDLKRAYPSLYAAAVGHEAETLARDLPAVARRLRGYLYVALHSLFGTTAVLHEGDWERATVIMEEDGTPELIVCDAHGHGMSTPWDSLEFVPDTDRPVLYSALGSHATVAGADRKAFGFDEIEPGGPRWETWEGIEAVDPWYGFGGAWGRVGRVSDLTGPLGPSPWKSGALVAEEFWGTT